MCKYFFNHKQAFIAYSEAMSMQKFGQIVKNRRTELQLTQAQVADIVRCSETTISKIENGRVGTIEADTLLGLAEALNWDLTSLRQAWNGKDPSLLALTDLQSEIEDSVAAYRDFLNARKIKGRPAQS